MDDQAQQKAFAASLLLGNAYALLRMVQEHLIMDQTKEALSKINEGVRFLTEKIDKHFYGEVKKENDDANNTTEG